MKLLKSLLLCLTVHGISSYKYYYKRIGNGFDIIYAQHEFGGYKELKSPKSLNVNHNNRGERPGVCSYGPFFCSVPYQRSATQHFECTLDYQCPRFFKCCQPPCFVHKVCQPAYGIEASSTLFPQPTITTDIWKTSMNTFSPATFTESQLTTHLDIIPTESTTIFFTTSEPPEPEPKIFIEITTSSEVKKETSTELTTSELSKTEPTETDEISESPPNIELMTSSKITETFSDETTESVKEIGTEMNTPSGTNGPISTEISDTWSQVSTEISTIESHEPKSPANIGMRTSSKTTETEMSTPSGTERPTSTETSLKESSETKPMPYIEISTSTDTRTQVSTGISTIETYEPKSPANIEIRTSPETTETFSDETTEPAKVIDTEISNPSRTNGLISSKISLKETSETQPTPDIEISTSTDTRSQVSTEISTIETYEPKSLANIETTNSSETTEILSEEITEPANQIDSEISTPLGTNGPTSTETSLNEYSKTEPMPYIEMSTSTDTRSQVSTKISTIETYEPNSPANIEIRTSSKSFSDETSEASNEKDSKISTPTGTNGPTSTEISLNQFSETKPIPDIEISTSTDMRSQVSTGISTIETYDPKSPPSIEITTSSKTTETLGDKSRERENEIDTEISNPSETNGQTSNETSLKEFTKTKPIPYIKINTSTDTGSQVSTGISSIETYNPKSPSNIDMSTTSEATEIFSDETTESANEIGTEISNSWGTNWPTSTEISINQFSKTKPIPDIAKSTSTDMRSQVSTGIFTIENYEPKLPASTQLRTTFKTTETFSDETTESANEGNTEISTPSRTTGPKSTEIRLIEFSKPIPGIEMSISTGTRSQVSTGISTIETYEPKTPASIELRISPKTTETFSNEITEPAKEVVTEMSTLSGTNGPTSTEISLKESSNETKPKLDNEVSSPTTTRSQVSTGISIIETHEPTSTANIEIRTSSKATLTFSYETTEPAKFIDSDISTPSATQGLTSTESFKTKRTPEIEVSTSSDTRAHKTTGFSIIETYESESPAITFTSHERIKPEEEADGKISTPSGTRKQTLESELTPSIKIITLTDQNTTEISTKEPFDSESPANLEIKTSSGTSKKAFYGVTETEVREDSPIVPPSVTREQTSTELTSISTTNIEITSMETRIQQNTMENRTSSGPRKEITTDTSGNYSTDDRQGEESTTQLTMTTDLPNTSSGLEAPSLSQVSTVEFTYDSSYTSSYVTEFSSEISNPISQLPSASFGASTDIKIISSLVKSNNLNSLAQVSVVGTSLVEITSEYSLIASEETSGKPLEKESAFELKNNSPGYIPKEKSSESYDNISGSDKKENVTKKDQSTEFNIDEQRKSGRDDVFDESNEHNPTKFPMGETGGANKFIKPTQKVSEFEKHRSLSSEENKSRGSTNYFTDDEDLASGSGSGDGDVGLDD